MRSAEWKNANTFEASSAVDNVKRSVARVDEDAIANYDNDYRYVQTPPSRSQNGGVLGERGRSPSERALLQTITHASVVLCRRGLDLLRPNEAPATAQPRLAPTHDRTPKGPRRHYRPTGEASQFSTTAVSFTRRIVSTPSGAGMPSIPTLLPFSGPMLVNERGAPA